MRGEDKKSMQNVVVLQHNEDTREIGRFLKKYEPKCKLKDFYPNLTIKKNLREEVRKTLKVEEGTLVFYATGYKHYYTYGLCKEIADKLSKSWTYIHIDRHGDLGNGTNEKKVGYGSFVDSILTDTNADELIYFGSSPGKSDTKRLGELGKKYVWDEKLERVDEILDNCGENVYVSSDLDLLSSEYIHTDFGNGEIKLKTLLDALRKIKHRKNILAADVNGYSSLGATQE
ncbi:MAG: arginase family protein, partial [Candidatus Aenigmarchaeota archaeon]|nr:arginase family protein [Candidatus Aenigmarchaeota archaeon]